MVSQTRIAGGKLILLLVTLSLVATPAVAQAAAQPVTTDGTDNANVEADQAGTGDDQLAGETINLHVSGADGSERAFSFEMTENGRIDDLERGAREDATVAMRTDRATFKRIAHAPDPKQKFRTAIQHGNVEMRDVDAPEDTEWDVFDSISELARSLGLS